MSNEFKLLLAFVCAFCFIAATVHPRQAEAKTCDGSKSALGVSRTVEIDTNSGPAFGTAQYKRFDFLRPGEVVLTFDDGPIPRTTGKILNALKRHCTKAVFFPLGRLAVTYPEIVRQTIAWGHTVGVHGWSHHNFARRSLKWAINDIEKGASAIKLTTQDAVAPFFRFPYLADSRTAIRYLKQRSFSVFSIDVDSKDYRARSSTQLVNSVMSKLRAKGKGILLFHDTKNVTAAAIPLLLDRLKRAGYKVVHVTAKDRADTLSTYDQKMQRYARKGLRRIADAGDGVLANIVRTLSDMEAAVKALKLNPDAISITQADKLITQEDVASTPSTPPKALSALDNLLSGRQEHYLRMNRELGRTRAKVQIRLAKLTAGAHQFETALQHYKRAQAILEGDRALGLNRAISAGLRATHAKRLLVEPDAQTASGWLTEMAQDGFEPTADERDVVVAKATTYAQAFKLVKRMQSDGHVPGPRASNRLIVLAPSFEAARRWVTKTKHRRHALTADAYAAIIRKAQTVSDAQSWFVAMRAAGHSPSDRLVADLLAKTDGYLPALKLLADLQSDGLKPSLTIHAALDAEFMDLEDWHVMYALRPAPDSGTETAGAENDLRTADRKPTGKSKKASKRKTYKRKVVKKRNKRLKKRGVKRRSVKRRSVKRRTVKRRSVKRRTLKRRVTKRKTVKRKTVRRSALKRKTAVRRIVKPKQGKRRQRQRVSSARKGRGALTKHKRNALRLTRKNSKRVRGRKRVRKKR